MPRPLPPSWGCSLSSPQASPALPPSRPPPRGAHPGVVAGVELLRHGGDVLHQELVPLPLKVDLVHVDVDGRHVLVAALDAVVLETTEGSVVSGNQRWTPGVQLSDPHPRPVKAMGKGQGTGPREGAPQRELRSLVC